MANRTRVNKPLVWVIWLVILIVLLVIYYCAPAQRTATPPKPTPAMPVETK